MSRPRSSLAAACVALALVGAQLGGILHAALVEHRRCPEHGEIVEGSPGQAAALPVVPPSRLGGVASIQPVSVAVDCHEHCLAAWAASAPMTPSGEATGLLVPDTRRLRAGRVGWAPPPSDPRRYRLAPKTSPPS